MLFNRLFNSRTLTVARKMSTLTRKSNPSLLKRAETVTQKRLMGHGPDISGAQAVAWLVFAGVPIAMIGVYITNGVHNRIEAFEAGTYGPKQVVVSNDEWCAIKAEIQKRHSDEDEEDEEEEEEEESPAVEVEEIAPEIEEEFVVIAEEPEPEETEKTLGKDTIIFVSADES